MANATNDQGLGFESRSFALVLIFSSAIVLVVSAWSGVEWFTPGDFEWREAMASHGLLIPAWMLLGLFAIERLGLTTAAKWKRLNACVALIAALLTGAGSLLIRREGFSVASALQGLGMILADIVGIVVLTILFKLSVRPREGFDRMAAWTSFVSFAALSLATPLGHLAAGVKDFGSRFFMFERHVLLLGMESEKVLDGYMDSHGHQATAAFLAAGFVLPLVFRSGRGPQWIHRGRTAGLILVLLATVAQSSLYQFSAWFAWEPPTLFAHEPNGMPLDDAFLALLGVGLVLLVPALLFQTRESARDDARSLFSRVALVSLLMSFLIAVVAVGVYIEFHEDFFGQGEDAGAPGRLNDLAYVRSHLLFGFVAIPLLLSALLHIGAGEKTLKGRAVCSIVLACAAAGTAGVFAWTFALNPIFIRISMYLVAVFLIVLATELLQQRGRRGVLRAAAQGGYEKN